MVNENVVDIYDFDGHFLKRWDIFPLCAAERGCFSETHIFLQDEKNLIVYDFDGNLAFKTVLPYWSTLDTFYIDGHLCGLGNLNLITYRLIFQ